MILFLHDFTAYPTCRPDFETKNQSFVDIAILYREMGVKNWMFPLALIDQKLKNVDPFDPNISKENVARITNECRANPWYFFREIARDPAGSEKHPLRLQANRGIIAAYWLFFNHILTTLIMIRQTGKSFGIDWLNIFLLNIGMSKGEISYLTKDEKLRGRTLERIKAMELTLPSYFKQRTSKDPGNTEVLRVTSRGNTFKAYVPNKSPKLADLIGRGMTAQVTVGDEFGYIHNNAITIPVMLSATLAARETARAKGDPFGTIFMTTSAKRDTEEGRYAYDFTNGSADFTEHFFDSTNEEELRARVLAACPDQSLGPRVNCTFNHRQLGKTDEWLMSRIRDSAQNDPVQIRADFFNEWPSGTLSSPFSQGESEVMRNSEKSDYRTEITSDGGYVLRWYYSTDEVSSILQNEPHVLSIDPSDAVGSDAIGITLRRASTGEIAMAADISEGNIIALCRWLSNFLIAHARVTLIIEARSQGRSIIDFLLDFLPAHGVDPFRRIYNTVVQHADEYPERFKEIQNPFSSRENLFIKYKKYFGFATSGSGETARDDLMGSSLLGSVRMTGSLMRDRRLILETLALTTKNGRIDHSRGKHDDLMFSWVLSYWLIASGKNLQHYGIDSSKILTQNPVFKQSLKETSFYQQHVHSKAVEDVERLKQKLQEERDEYIIQKYEHELEMAASRMNKEDRAIFSVDDLIKTLRERRTAHTPTFTANSLQELMGKMRQGYNLQQSRPQSTGYQEVAYYN